MRKKSVVKKPIIIDPGRDLKFANEDQLYKHFHSQIKLLESEYTDLKIDNDISETEHDKYEKNLTETLESPDEIWVDNVTFNDQEVSIFLKEFLTDDEESIFHVAVTYTANGVPSFVYLHFPTRHLDLIEKYQRGEIAYDRILEEAPKGAIEGDALLEGDELALGFYQAMLKVRSEDDIPETEYRSFAEHRELAIEDADEIWRHNDPFGNVLVNFIKEFSEEGSERIHYVVVTIEDAMSNSHALLFSFPTKDSNLVSRYRQGENLQAEDVSQESSH